VEISRFFSRFYLTRDRCGIPTPDAARLTPTAVPLTLNAARFTESDLYRVGMSLTYHGRVLQLEGSVKYITEISRIPKIMLKRGKHEGKLCGHN
jgi:hypothetical protein